MAIEIGSKGLEEVNLIIPQETSLTFDVVHTTEDGDVIDHSESTAHMAFQSKDKTETYQLDGCVSCGAESIKVSIPASASETMPIGKMVWDLIVTTVLGEQIRLCYGTVQITDTYALDED